MCCVLVPASTTQAATPASDSDAALVRATREGKLRAFEMLVDRHRGVAVRVAGRVVGPADADDVTQDAFLRAFHRLDQFREDAAFQSWLLRIVHNAAIDHLRRRPPEPVDLAGVADSPDAATREPATRLETRERIERLERKLRGLSPAHRAVLVLRDVEQLDYAEIAEITDSPVGSVKGRLNRARGEFIAMLRANTYDWELPE